MRRLLWIILVLLPSISFADNMRDHVEASTVVTGWVEIGADGGVHAYALDQLEKLDAGVVNFIGKTVATWKFEPVMVDGKPVLAKAKMNLRLVASSLGNGQYELRVRGATFGNGKSDEWPSSREGRAPAYPIVALRSQIAGTVYLALEIDRTGHVEQAVARQVDLRAIGLRRDMEILREAFAQTSVAAAKAWTFKVPEAGAEKNAEHWTVSIPVNFNIDNGDSSAREPRYGQWKVYVPGPVQPIPWELDQVANDNNADAIPDGPAFLSDKRFVLLTPPSPG